MKDLPARHLFAKERRELKDRGRMLHDRSCPFCHSMKALEPGVWYCSDPQCQVLVVYCVFQGSYEYHNGTQHLFFDRDEAADYLAGKQSLTQLVETRF